MDSCTPTRCLSLSADLDDSPDAAQRLVARRSTPLTYDTSSPASLGDIYCLKQSVKKTYLRILAPMRKFRKVEEFRKKPSQPTSGRYSRHDGGSLTPSEATANTSQGRTRPCIINDIGDDGLEIFLMTTYDDSAFDELPQLHRLFSIAVYPDDGHPTHIHTDPDWAGKKSQWVIAYAYQVDEPAQKCRWENTWTTGAENQTYTVKTNHRVSLDTLIALRETSFHKMDEWQTMCKDDPQLATRMRQDCRDYRSPKSDARRSQRGSYGSPRTSRSSLAKSSPSYDSIRRSSLEGFSEHQPEAGPSGSQNLTAQMASDDASLRRLSHGKSNIKPQPDADVQYVESDRPHTTIPVVRDLDSSTSKE